MEYKIKNFNKELLKKRYPSYVMGVDIGGTRTNLGIAGVKNLKVNLLFSLDFNSNDLSSLIPALEDTLSYANNYNIEVDVACIGAAGIVSPSNDYAQITNTKWNASSKELTNKTALSTIFIINDFQSIGYGINLLDSKNKNDIIQIRRSIKPSFETKVILGAGTGLGKSILTYDYHYNAYMPLQSEGGHEDFPIQNDFEMEMVQFIKKLQNISHPLTYEEILSGRGIESLYQFLRASQDLKETQYTDKIENANNKAPLISKYRNQDETCKKTFRLFTRFYARCAKNFVLDAFARGGLYIAGGIAVKNREIFTTKDFIEEFENAYRRTDFLKTVPISVIINYDVSLYGACFAAMYKLYCKQ
jgi:glucokinase